MINDWLNVTNSVEKERLEEISTRGYDFYWTRNTNGYEWRNQDDLIFDAKLHNFIHTHQTISPHLFRYKRDALFYVVSGDSYSAPPTSLYELPLALIDTQSPWLVPKGSLELAQKQALTKPGPLDYQSVPTRAYKPLSCRTLHRKFSALDTNNMETEVLRFAGDYGELGRPVTLWSPEDNDAPDSFRDLYAPNRFRWNLPSDKRAIVHGESLFRWRGEIEKMGVLLAIWDLIRNKEAGKLGQFFLWRYNPDYVQVRLKWRYQKGQYEIYKWDGKEEVAEFGHHSEIIANRRLSPDFFNEYKEGYVIGPAWYWLGGQIKRHLHWIRPTLRGYHPPPEVTYIPRTLLDALWLLFMLEVQGKVKVARCQYCREWFEFERSSKTYCSGNCRRLAFYHREKPKEKEAQNERVNNQT